MFVIKDGLIPRKVSQHKYIGNIGISAIVYINYVAMWFL